MAASPVVPAENNPPNPILENIRKGQIGPLEQQAIQRSGITPPAPAQPQPQPEAVRPLSAPTSTAGLGELSPSPASSVVTPHMAERNRLTAPPLSGPLAHTSADTGRSGIEQIHNPIGRHTLEVLDAIGTGFFPRLAMGIPGTSLHHNLLVHQATGNVNEDEKLLQDQAQQQHEAAGTELEQAQIPKVGAETSEANARTQSLLHPPPKQEEAGKTITTDKGIMQWNPETQRYDIPAGNSPEKEQQNVHVLPDGSVVAVHHDPATGKSTAEVLYKGEPGEKPVVTKLEIGGKPHSVLVDEKTGKTIKDLGETGEKPPTVNVNAGEAHQDRIKGAAFKAYSPALDSAERFNVMTNNYEDAVKNHDQQAMLSLLANHLGMTMGLQKGARMTRDIIREAEQSRPWLQGLEAKFDKDGYLTGVNLTPQQMRQMVNLGRERFTEDLTKGRNEARYQGSTDEGPERTPNEATIRFYIGQANGDAKKAKELAAKDGWTIH
jgi:hypothetical protein